MSAVDAPLVLTDVADGVLVITINRPAKRNAIDLATAEALAAAMAELDRRPELVVGVLTGAGGTFSAGMDLAAFRDGIRPATDPGGFAGFVECPPEKPLIAAVEGHALGGGFEISLACDLVVSARTTVFGLPEVRRGLVAGAGGLLRLPRMIPERLATELILTGENLTAQRAFELGLVNRVTEPGAALDGALTLARQIAANGPLAVRASKQVIVRARDWPAADQFPRQREITGAVFASNDAREGARAFAEKRAPSWTGT